MLGKKCLALIKLVASLCCRAYSTVKLLCSTKDLIFLLASGTFKESANIFSSVMDLAVALWGNLSMLSNDQMDTGWYMTFLFACVF